MDDPRHTHCGACGYELLGLATHGRCPECGQYYDVYTGEGFRSRVSERERRGHQLIARLRTICVAIGTLLVIACGGLAGALSQNPKRALSVAAVLAGLGGSDPLRVRRSVDPDPEEELHRDERRWAFHLEIEQDLVLPVLGLA